MCCAIRAAGIRRRASTQRLRSDEALQSLKRAVPVVAHFLPTNRPIFPFARLIHPILLHASQGLCETQHCQSIVEKWQI